MIYLDRVESRWPLRLHFEIGSHVPIHCTASGKILLAAMKPAERRRIVDAVGLPAYTPHTITSRAEFDAELSRIAQQGYSLDREEFLLGMAAIAVPVMGLDGDVIAAVACHAPSVRFNVERAKNPPARAQGRGPQIVGDHGALSLVPDLRDSARQIPNFALTRAALSASARIVTASSPSSRMPFDSTSA